MHPEITDSFLRKWFVELDPVNGNAIYQGYREGLDDKDDPRHEASKDFQRLIGAALQAAFETADYCPSCLEIVPIREIVLERCLECWHKMHPQSKVLLQAHAKGSGVDPDALARLERKLETSR